MSSGLKKEFILAGLCFLMTHCASQKQGSMASPDQSKAIKNSSSSTASLKEKVKQKSKFSGLVNPKQQDEKRTKKKKNSSSVMDENPDKPVRRSIEKPKSMAGGLLPARAKIETLSKSKPKDLTQAPQPNISKSEKAPSHPKTKRKVSDQSTYRKGNPPPSPNFQNGKTAGNAKILKLGQETYEVNKPALGQGAGVAETKKSGKQDLDNLKSASKEKISVSSLKNDITLEAPSKKGGDRNVTDVRDYIADQNYTQRAGLTVGWKAEPQVTEEETNSKPRTLSESVTQPHGNDWNHLKSYLNRNAVLFGDDRSGQMNSLQRVEHWNEGRKGRAINLSDQGGDGPRFQEALRWIQQKGR